MRHRDAGMTLVEVAAGVTLVGIVVALLVPCMLRSARFHRVVECEGHLHAMYEAQSKAPAADPKEIGGAYWTRLTRTSPPLITEQTLRCPMVDAADAPACQYLGPCEDPAKAGQKEPIGCDQMYNHSDDGSEGGNLLLKSGEVVTDRTGLWFSAVRHNKCRP